LTNDDNEEFYYDQNNYGGGSAHGGADMLYYVHGYQSTPNSTKGMLFQKRLNARSIDYHRGKPEDLEIIVCVQNIVKAIQGDNEPVLIGSSLGGLLAVKVAALDRSPVKTLILLNPAIIPPQADISRIKGIPERLLSEMRDDRLFEKKISAQTIILMATKDEVIPRDWILDFGMAQEATIRFLNDDHAFTSNLNRLPNIVGVILGIRKFVV
jgi:predicted esterase YcpF (UPF0227 family)